MIEPTTRPMTTHRDQDPLTPAPADGRLLTRIPVSRPASMPRTPLAATAPVTTTATVPATSPVPAKTPAPARAKAPVKEPRRPYHLGVAIGLSAGVYATSLAAVTVLQIDQDKQTAADRQPVGDAISMLGSHNDHLAAGLSDARSVFDEASRGYGSVVDDIGELQIAVANLGKLVGRIEGTSTDFQLPSMVRLPSISRSGSGSGSGSTSSKPAAKPAPPPPANGGTGASGKP